MMITPPPVHVTNGATFTSSIAESLQDLDYRYNIRGQLTSINNSTLSNDGVTNTDANDLFGMEFVYDQAVAGLGNTQYYNGRISAIKWRTRDAAGNMGNERSYKYSYDEVNRLTAANYQEKVNGNWDNSGAFNENGITYDENGNIKTMQRNAKNASNVISAVDNLTYTYDSNNANKLLSVVDATGNAFGFHKRTTTSGTYTYDDNGNLLNDPFKGMALTYNESNRVSEINVSSGAGGKLVYTYDAASVLLRKQQYNNSNVLQKTTDYSDGFVYENNNLAYFGMPEGRVRNAAGVLKMEYIITDQQGNSRVSFEDNNGVAKIIQENSYYAFGMTMPNSTVITPTEPNKNLYNGGSEIQDDLGGLPDLMQTYYRNYDAALGRWTGVDPLASATRNLTPYHYAENNPISLNDPLGDLSIHNGDGTYRVLHGEAWMRYMQEQTEAKRSASHWNEDYNGFFNEGVDASGAGGIHINGSNAINSFLGFASGQYNFFEINIATNFYTVGKNDSQYSNFGNKKGGVTIFDYGYLTPASGSTQRWHGSSGSWENGANETPGVNVYHNLTYGGNWSYPGLGIHLYPNQPLYIQQHEYGHYLQYKKMNIVSYTWFVAIPSSINLALINMGVHTDDHDIQDYELEATTLADGFYGRNSRVGGTNSPTFRDYPELAPKTFGEGWNDIVRQFNAWASWGH